MTGWFIKRREVKAEEPAPSTGKIIAVGGMLQDGRALEQLTTQLGHNERATRDAERATIDNTHATERATEMMTDVRRALDARNRAAQDHEATIMAALAKARGVNRGQSDEPA